MDERPHKAHRPAQSGSKAEKKDKAKGKGKEKQHGFNEKVIMLCGKVAAMLTLLHRHSPRNQGDVQIAKGGVM